MRPVRDWLNLLPGEYREMAIGQTAYSSGRVRVATLSDALTEAFDWRGSEEGFEFWEAVCLYVEGRADELPEAPD